MAKHAKGKLKTKPAKRVPSAPPAPPVDKHLGWRMSQVDFGGPWGWQNLAGADLAKLRQQLVEFETIPLWQLKDRKWVKLIPLKEMKHTAAERLEEIDRDDEGLWQLHLGHNKWRVWGFLDEATFYFLWWDPDHTVATGKCRNRNP